MALILIIDDSPTEVHAMKTALEKGGFKTVTAKDGQEGVRLAQRNAPDLIFMDVVMPGMNGYQATRAIVNDPGTSSIPDGHGFLEGPGDRPRVGPAPGRGGLHGQAGHPGHCWCARPRQRSPLEAGLRQGRTSGVNASPTSIRALLGKPYEMLVALDKRGREVNATPGEAANVDREWVGVAWRMAGEAYLGRARGNPRSAALSRRSSPACPVPRTG